MSKKKNKRPDPAFPPESPAAEAITIGWMLAMLATLACQLGAIGFRMYFGHHPESQTAAILAEVFQFVALAIGLVSLILVPIVYKTRTMPPPLGITLFAVAVGSAPVVGTVLQMLQK